MSAPRRLLIVHPSSLRGENRGVYVQHVSSLQWLLDDAHDWSVVALDPLHPAFPELALASDVVVAHMLPQREIETMIRIRHERHLPTVFELSDNFLGVGNWLPRTHLLRSPLVRQRLLYHASLCDALQVYSPGLRELFARVNPRVALFDPYVPIPDEMPAKADGFVFGWGGTTSHEDDLQRIAPAIIEFCAHRRDAIFSYMGDVDLFWRHFAPIRTEQIRVAPFGPFETYVEFLRSLHAGIAPADPSAFNAGRSDTKLLMYAAAGVAPLLSDVAPYRAHAAHALLFRTAEELGEMLDELYVDRAQLQQLAACAFAWAAHNRRREVLRAQRDSFYRSLLREEPVADGAFSIEPAPAEAATLSEVGLQPAAEALEIVRGLVDMYPSWAQARWTMVSLLDRLGRTDEVLDELTRFAWPLLFDDGVEELRARSLSGNESREHIARIRSPFTRLRLQARDHADRSEFFRAILDEQPYDYFALSAAIRILERSDPRSPELQALYARACLVSPESVSHAQRPADLAEFLPA